MIASKTAAALIRQFKGEIVTLTLVDGTMIVGEAVSVSSKGVTLSVEGKPVSTALSKIETIDGGDAEADAIEAQAVEMLKAKGVDVSAKTPGLDADVHAQIVEKGKALQAAKQAKKEEGPAPEPDATGRTYTSHADCIHPRTPKARAICRAARKEAAK